MPWPQTNWSAWRRVCSSTVSQVAAIRASMSSRLKAYRGSHETTRAPRRVASALKAAGPSPQPSDPALEIGVGVSANSCWYSSNDRPQGTT